MRICGLQTLSMVDYPGKLAATVFTGGCNLRCPFCHNALLVTRLEESPILQQEEILSFLKRRRGLLDGVVLSGGEPLIQPGVPEFLQKVRALGFSIKLDTNGCYPDALEALQTRSNVTILPETRIAALESRDGALTGLLLEHAVSGAQSHLDVDGLFAAVGQQPDTALSQALGIAGEDGYIPAGEDCRTAIGGIFVAGDCRTKDVRQLTTACADGASAALAACRWCVGQTPTG